MKNKTLTKVGNLINSLRLRVFVIVLLAITIPVLISSIFIFKVSITNYKDNRINGYNATNTLLKNTILNEGMIEKGESTSVDTQVNQLTRRYDCHVQIVNSQNVIIKDTDSGQIGKISISEYVNKAFKGENIYVEHDDYVEFAIPITNTATNADGTITSNITGVLYISYSLIDVTLYAEALEKTVSTVALLLIVFAILIAYGCGVMFSRPIKRIETSIDDISQGKKTSVKKDYYEVMVISNEFKQLMDKINAQEASRQEFVSNVSHELKTPITSMKILADSLIGNMGMPEELYQEFLQDISKEIDRENDIITDLLNIVRMDKPESSINISSVNINDIVEAVLKRLKKQAELKNIELIYESFRPVIADVDEIKISSVITNLVENAIKYNNTDGTVTTSLNSDHQYFYLKVTDTGIGIAEEDQEKVFERFFRVDKARARETGGTGLGLAITQQIVKKHHGEIKVHSKEGEGTTFTVRIPLKYIKNDGEMYDK